MALAERRSVMTKLEPVSLTTAWWRLTSASSSTTSLSASLPIRVAIPVNG
jgi:hypothetical protein